MTDIKKTCLQCEKVITGRVDKKFCSTSCRNTFNNKLNSDQTKLIRNINNTLKRNRRILESFLTNKEETLKVKRSILIQEGFDFNYFTSIYKTHKEQSYFFVYEYGYLHLGNEWLLIVKKS